MSSYIQQVQFNAAAVVTLRWGDFLTIVQNKGLNMQYVTNPDTTITVFALDSAIAYQCLLVPAALAATYAFAPDYSEAQNNTDYTTFTTSYQATSNMVATTAAVSGVLAVSQKGAAQVWSEGALGVSGTVSVGNFPANQQVWIAEPVGVTGSLSVTFPANQEVWVAAPVGVTASATLPVQGVAGGVPLQVWSEGSIGISGSVSVSNFPATQTIQGAPAGSAAPVQVWSEGALPVSGTLTSIIGNWPATFGVSASATLPVSQQGQVSVNNFPATQNVSGTVNVGNFPATQNVQGTAGGTPIQIWSEGPIGVTGSFSATTSTTGSAGLAVGNAPYAPLYVAPGSTNATFNVAQQGQISVNNFPATQNVSGTVTANVTFPTNQQVWIAETQGVSGTVGAVINNWPATLGVSASATLPVSQQGQVSVNNFPATQNVSGTVTVGNANGIRVYNDVAVGVSGTVNVGNSQLSINNFPATQNVSGSVAITNSFLSSSAPVDKNGTGNLGALNATVVASTGGCSTVIFNLEGTWVGSIIFEGQAGDSNWQQLQAWSFAGDSLIMIASANQMVAVQCGGMVQVRARMSAYTSGTATLVWNAATGNNAVDQVAIVGTPLIVVDGETPAGTAPYGNPVLIGGVNNSGLTTTILTDPNGNLTVAAASPSGFWHGGTVGVSGSVTLGSQVSVNNFPATQAVSGTVTAVGAAAAGAAASGNPVLIGGENIGTGLIEPLGSVIDRSAMSAGGQTGIPIIGQSSGVGRIARYNRLGYVLPGYQTLLAADLVEGSTVNSWLWTQSTTTMTIAQTTGLLTLNNGAITTINTDAIITSTRQFALYNQAPLGLSFKAVVANYTNAVNELGFGAPTGTTATVNNGAFFRITTGGNVYAVTSTGGNESVSTVLATLSSSTYYIFMVWIEDGGARFIIESESGIPLVDYFWALGPTVPGVAAAVSHLPAFARVYNTGTAPATATTTKIASFQAWQYDINASKPWAEQLAGAGRSSIINPTSFAQTPSSMIAAPSTETPSNTVAGYNALGGDYAVALTTASENPLSVFAFQVPSPYTFYLTGLVFSVPFVSTTIGVTGVPILEWLAIVNNSNGNISTGGGQRFPVGLNILYTSATQAAGLFCTAQGNLAWYPKVPIVCLPGTYLHLAYKVFITSAVGTPGVTRGSVFVDGYFE
jgi:hypothetical protein